MGRDMLRRDTATTGTGDDGDAISRGSYTATTVKPRFRSRTLARMDALGPAWADMRGRAADRAIRRAQKNALKDIDAARRKARDEERRRRRERRPEDDSGLPLDHGLASRLGLGLGFGSRDRVSAPWHSTSVARAGILTPWLAQGAVAFDGPPIGIDWTTGSDFRFDAWAPYKEHMVTSVNMLIAGMMGTGKSMCLKTLADREIAWGRNVIIEGDPKGEWARFARIAGGAVVGVGDGQCINPLDVGTPGDGESDADWANRADSMRVEALRGLAAAIRPSQPLDMAERALLAAAVTRLREGRATPTITGLVALLSSEWPREAGIRGLDAQDAAASAARLTLLFDTLVTGPLRGSFDQESTVRIDPACPLIVFDTGSADDGSQRKAVYTAAMAAAIDRVCASHDGMWRIVIAEEGWDVLRNPALVAGWDRRMRLSGDLGVANIMLMHELSDLEQAGDAGSAQRRRIEGILTKSSTSILYQQSPASLRHLRRLMPDLTDDEAAAVASLPQGVGLWRVGSAVRQLVLPLVSPDEYRAFNTDAGRAG